MAFSGRVLVVEDNPLNAEMMSEMLAGLGYETTLCQDGQKAVELYGTSGSDFAAILLDLNIPRLDGRKVLARVLEMDPAACVLMVTGSAAQEVDAEMMQLGACGVLHKPFKMDALSEALRSALAAR